MKITPKNKGNGFGDGQAAAFFSFHPKSCSGLILQLLTVVVQRGKLLFWRLVLYILVGFFSTVQSGFALPIQINPHSQRIQNGTISHTISTT